jgi:hypothetical protein
MAELYKALFSRGFVEHACVVGALAWIADLGHHAAAAKQNSPRITLLGQFNWDTSEQKLEVWASAWSGLVQHLHPYVPNATIAKGVTRYTGDRGYVSPYKNLAAELRGTAVGEAVLYAHDDLLVAPDTVKSFGTAWASMPPRAFPWPTKGNLTWNWWGVCSESLKRIIAAGTVESLINTPLVLEGSHSILAFGQSDMLYVMNNNATITAMFCDILDAFAEHKLFLECAVPTALRIMQQQYGVAVRNLTLCTDWGQYRGNMTTAPCYAENNFDVLHPVKNANFILASRKVMGKP